MVVFFFIISEVAIVVIIPVFAKLYFSFSYYLSFSLLTYFPLYQVVITIPTKRKKQRGNGAACSFHLNHRKSIATSNH